MRYRLRNHHSGLPFSPHRALWAYLSDSPFAQPTHDARLSGPPADRFQTASWLILHNRNYTEPLEGDHSGLLTPSDCPVTGNDIAPALAGNRTMTSLQNRTALHVAIASSYASRCPRRIGATCRNRTGSCAAYGATVQRALHHTAMSHVCPSLRAVTAYFLPVGLVNRPHLRLAEPAHNPLDTPVSVSGAVGLGPREGPGAQRRS